MQKKNVTANLPKDYERQLQEDQLNKEFAAHEKKESRREEFRKERDAAKQERERLQRIKEEEARKERERKIQAEKNIAANAAKVRERQEGTSAAEFRAITAKNDARIKQEQKDIDALNNAKTGSERIKIRQRIEARREAENERIARANAPKQQAQMHQITGAGGIVHNVRMHNKGLITPGTVAEAIKGSVKKAVRKAPAAADRVVTGTSERFMNVVTAPTRASPKTYARETKQLSRAVKGHAQYPVSGGRMSVPIVKSNAIFPNPDFTDAILGRTPLKSQTSKTKKAQSGLDRLNQFARGLL